MANDNELVLSDTYNVSPRGVALIDYHTKRFFALFEPGLKYAQTDDYITRAP